MLDDEKRMQQEQQFQLRIENLKGAIKLAEHSLKATQLINGGAIVASLTLYGAFISSGKIKNIDNNEFILSMGLYCGALFCSVAASAFAYISQLHLCLQNNFVKREKSFRLMAIILVFIGLILFLAGAVTEVRSLLDAGGQAKSVTKKIDRASVILPSDRMKACIDHENEGRTPEEEGKKFCLSILPDDGGASEDAASLPPIQY